jgi:hypothetical protein
MRSIPFTHGTTGAAVSDIQFTADGNRLISGSVAGTDAVWSVENDLRFLRELEVEAAPMDSLCVTGNNFVAAAERSTRIDGAESSAT